MAPVVREEEKTSSTERTHLYVEVLQTCRTEGDRRPCRSESNDRLEASTHRTGTVSLHRAGTPPAERRLNPIEGSGFLFGSFAGASPVARGAAPAGTASEPCGPMPFLLLGIGPRYPGREAGRGTRGMPDPRSTKKPARQKEAHCPDTSRNSTS